MDLYVKLSALMIMCKRKTRSWSCPVTFGSISREEGYFANLSLNWFDSETNKNLNLDSLIPTSIHTTKRICHLLQKQSTIPYKNKSAITHLVFHFQSSKRKLASIIGILSIAFSLENFSVWKSCFHCSSSWIWGLDCNIRFKSYHVHHHCGRKNVFTVNYGEYR